MPAEKTRADSLREYLTGAASDGEAQTDPNASLGSFRSSTEAVSATATVTDAISNITIDYVGGGNTEGDGILNVVDSNTVQWKCFGGSYGPQVAIANGETKIVETDGSPEAFLRISRTTADALSGSATVTIAKARNNVFALDDVSSAEALAGDTEYRATLLVNDSAVTVASVKRYIGELATSQTSDGGQLASSGAGTLVTTGSFADWPESGFCHIKSDASTTREIVYYSERNDTTLTIPATGRALLGSSAAAGSAGDTIHCVPGIAIAIDSNGVTAGAAEMDEIADESTAPASISGSWNTGITAATGLQIGDMTTGQQVGIWIKRQIPEAAIATASAQVLIKDSFDAA